MKCRFSEKFKTSIVVRFIRVMN